MSQQTRIVSEIVSDLLMCRDHLRQPSKDLPTVHRLRPNRVQYSPPLTLGNRSSERPKVASNTSHARLQVSLTVLDDFRPWLIDAA